MRRRKGKDPRGEGPSTTSPLDVDTSTPQQRSLDPVVSRHEHEGAMSGAIGAPQPMSVVGDVPQEDSVESHSTVLGEGPEHPPDDRDQHVPELSINLEQQPDISQKSGQTTQHVFELPTDLAPVTPTPGDSRLQGWFPPEPPTDQTSTQGQGDKPTKVKLWNATAEITDVVTTKVIGPDLPVRNPVRAAEVKASYQGSLFGGARPKMAPTPQRRGTPVIPRGMPVASTSSASVIGTDLQPEMAKDVQSALCDSFREASAMAKEMTSAAKSLSKAAQNLGAIISTSKASGNLKIGATSSVPQPSSHGDTSGKRRKGSKQESSSSSSDNSDDDSDLADIGSMSSGTRQVKERSVKLPPFTGKERWKIWFNRFNDVANRHKWSNETRLDELLPRLQGQAGEFVFGQLCKKIRGNLPELTKELENRFRKVETTKVFGVKFTHRDQKPGETAEEYAAELKRLYDKAYGRRDKQTRKEDLLRRFLDGLSDEGARFHVEYIKDPEDIDAAVFEVVNFLETRGRTSLGESAGERRAKKAYRSLKLHEAGSDDEGDDDAGRIARALQVMIQLRKMNHQGSSKAQAVSHPVHQVHLWRKSRNSEKSSKRGQKI